MPGSSKQLPFVGNPETELMCPFFFLHGKTQTSLRNKRIWVMLEISDFKQEVLYYLGSRGQRGAKSAQ